MYDSDVYQREDVGLASRRIHYLPTTYTVQTYILFNTYGVYGTADNTTVCSYLLESSDMRVSSVCIPVLIDCLHVHYIQ